MSRQRDVMAASALFDAAWAGATSVEGWLPTAVRDAGRDSAESAQRAHESAPGDSDD